MSERRRRILLMPEYGIDIPLWDRSDFPRDGFDPEHAGISEQLLERLRAWNDEWLEAHREPEEPSRWPRAQFLAWKQLGRRLARQLRAELPDVEVLVFDESQ